MSDSSVFFFAVSKDSKPFVDDTIDSVLEQHAKGFTFIWLDLASPSLEDLHRVGKAFGLDDEALQDAIEGEQRPRLDDFDEHALIVMYGALGPESGTAFSPRKLAIFIGINFVITIHNDPLITINRQRARMSNVRSKLSNIRSDTVLYTLMDAMVDNYLKVVNDYQLRLDDMEERSLEAAPDETLMGDVLKLRRDLLGLRRLATSLRELLHPFVTGELDFVSERIATDFIHVRDHLTQTIESIDNLRELLNGVRDNFNAMLATRANNVMQTLTIFASLFLPLTLVAGIYGMNTPLFPSVENPATFWGIIIFMGVTMTAMLGFFKYRKWF